MRKKSTLNIHKQIANDAMTYIYKYLDTQLNLDELALSFHISKDHLHKLFKEQMGINIYEFIKLSRLQKASNLLLTNKHSTITQIANMCGYSSQTSFIRAFKARFSLTPKQWRNNGYLEYSNEILKTSKLSSYKKISYKLDDFKIIKTKAKKAYYIRQKGYSIVQAKQMWQKLMAWTYTNEIQEYEQIGIYHDNPAITPHKDSFYVAAIALEEDVKIEETSLPFFYLPQSLYACFEIEGIRGDVLRFIQWIYHIWLPQSGYETTTNPPYAVFTKNQFLEDDMKFKARYYLPIKFV